MDELLEQFLIEGRELVQQASDDLLALERDPANAARLDSAFRAFHTLKGSVALFDLAPMGWALHAAEDVLGAIRAGRLSADLAVIDILLECIGATDAWIDAIARTETLPADAEAQGRRLQTALIGRLKAESAVVAVAPVDEFGWLPALLARQPRIVADARAGGRTLTALRYVPNGDCFFLGDDPLALVRSLPDLLILNVQPREPWSVADFNPFDCNLVIEAVSAATPEAVAQIFRFVKDQTSITAVGAAPQEAPSAGDAPVIEAGQDASMRSLRVDAARIDGLVDIVGELIVAKNGLAQLVSQAAESDPRLARALSASQVDIERLVGNMHRSVMGLRMTPLARTFRRFPRLVRDLAARLGKPATFTLSGDEVEADKTIVDGLYDPLLHLLRNAVDHGLETAEARTASGKPATGKITLDARREGEEIVITVSDDGGGIDLDKVRRVAKDRRLMSDAAIDALDDAGAADLIFMPGFSTAAAVTDVSGRGVGLDVVRSAVEALGGRIALTSVPGAGSTARLTLPQTVVITTVMAVRLGDEQFGVPIETVAEIARVPTGRILPIRQGEAFVLRDQTIPLLRLSDLLAAPRAQRPPGDAKIMIVVADEQRVGIEVDGFAERFDVLLRPMTGMLASIPGMRGTALLGDGRVLLVLDLPELVG